MVVKIAIDRREKPSLCTIYLLSIRSSKIFSTHTHTCTRVRINTLWMNGTWGHEFAYTSYLAVPASDWYDGSQGRSSMSLLKSPLSILLARRYRLMVSIWQKEPNYGTIEHKRSWDVKPLCSRRRRSGTASSLSFCCRGPEIRHDSTSHPPEIASGTVDVVVAVADVRL